MLHAVCMCFEVSRQLKESNGLKSTYFASIRIQDVNCGVEDFSDFFAARLTYQQPPADLRIAHCLSLLRPSEGLAHPVTLRSGSSTCPPLPWGIPRQRSAASRRLPALPYIISSPVCSNTPPHSPLYKHLGLLVANSSDCIAYLGISTLCLSP